MTTETQYTISPTEYPYILGARFKSARETLGLDRKQAAAKLRLTEKVIVMMENDTFPTELPDTFIRGYIRSYGKLLDVPEYEVKQALEPLKPKQVEMKVEASLKQTLPAVTSRHYFMQFFTYLIVFTVVGLVGVWWYSHGTTPTTTTAAIAMAPAAPVVAAALPVAITPNPVKVAAVTALPATPDVKKKIVQAYANSSDTDDDNSNDNADSNDSDSNNNSNNKNDNNN